MSDPEIGGIAASDASGPAAAQERPPGPGAQLGAHRQSLGWSIEQVANQLNLAPRQIQALEQDNYAALPGMVIARGFVRAYAKLLKLDPAPFVARMADETNSPPEAIELRRALAATYSDSSLPSGGGSRSQGKWALFALLAIALAAGWWAHRTGWLDKALSSMTAKSTMPTSGGPDTSRHSAAPAVSSPPSGDASRVPAASGEPKPINQATPQPGAEAAVVATPRPASDGLSKQLSPDSARVAAPDNRLTIKFREDSWIEIKRADKSTIASKLVKAGNVESFDIDQPASLVIGNAAGVDVSFKGAPLDLKPASQSNVARLALK